MGDLEHPMLMMAGGDEDGSDGLVMNAETKAFCLSQSGCTYSNYPGGMHGLHFGIDERRDRVFGEMDGFFTNHTTVPPREDLGDSSGLPNGVRCSGDSECASGYCTDEGLCADRATFVSHAIGQGTPVFAAWTAAAFAATTLG